MLIQVSTLKVVSLLTCLINEAYKIGEAGILVDTSTQRFIRVTEDDLIEAITDQKILELQHDNGNIIGCIKVSKIHDDVAEWGCLAVAQEYQGMGYGSVLVRAAEDHIYRNLNCHVAQLDLLAPTHWKHIHKERLRGWYQRMGYHLAKGSYEESTIRLPCHSKLGDFIIMATDVDCTTYQKKLDGLIVDH